MSINNTKNISNLVPQVHSRLIDVSNKINRLTVTLNGLQSVERRLEWQLALEQADHTTQEVIESLNLLSDSIIQVNTYYFYFINISSKRFIAPDLFYCNQAASKMTIGCGYDYVFMNLNNLTDNDLDVNIITIDHFKSLLNI
jgi:hypothetical protein